MHGGERFELTIVVPAYNERSNVEPLLRSFLTLRETWDRPFRVLIVDDGSPDGTADLAADLAGLYQLPLRVLRRKGTRSLGRSIAEGLAACDTDLACVMDADLSHPAALIPRLYDLLNGFEGVVASRYASGGETHRWPRWRRAISRGATALVRKATRTACTDPLSGFFLLRRAAWTRAWITGRGGKPLAEILADPAFTFAEVPYRFEDRRHGRSKLGLRRIGSFVGLLPRLRAMAKLARGKTVEDVLEAWPASRQP